MGTVITDDHSPGRLSSRLQGTLVSRATVAAVVYRCQHLRCEEIKPMEPGLPWNTIGRLWTTSKALRDGHFMREVYDIVLQFYCVEDFERSGPRRVTSRPAFVDITASHSNPGLDLRGIRTTEETIPDGRQAQSPLPSILEGKIVNSAWLRARMTRIEGPT